MAFNVKEKLKGAITKKRIIILVLLILVIGGGTGVYLNRNKLFAKKGIAQRTTVVKKGEINVTVTGSGPLTYSQSSVQATEVAGKITKLYFKQGDKVKAGDLIAEIDDKDAAQDLQAKENALQQAQVSDSSGYIDPNSLLVKAPFTGQVSAIAVTTGATIQKGAAIATVTDTSKLKLMVPFNTADASKISVGQTATVSLTTLMQSVQGTVAYINNQTDTTSSGGKVIQVEIDINNPGGLLGAMTANADVNTASGVVSSVQNGSLAYINQQIVYAAQAGTVGTIQVQNGQKVNSGDLLVSLQDNTINQNNQLGDLKVQSAASSVALAQQTLADYKIYSSIDGAITSLTLNVGDNVNAEETIATVENTNQIQFEAPIDELDVPKLAVGQKVKVTMDALPETTTTPLEGVVETIPYDGTATDGVATFNITIQITSPSDKLKSGMNANAEIEVNDVKNVLEVPVEAVTETNNKKYVWVKSSSKNSASKGKSKSSSSSNSYYANAVKKLITVGVNNTNYIQVTSGLSEGDVIILPQLQTADTSSSSSGGMGMGGGGGGGSTSKKSSSTNSSSSTSGSTSKSGSTSGSSSSSGGGKN